MARTIRLDLTEAEARALLRLCQEGSAGDLYELMDRNAQRVAAAERAERKVREALEPRRNTRT
ncbi:hypothetical protein [Micromonospora sp. WMMC273]|uniref:hypothetical protein n=1 Tax=Micromonospora sp. WMMC273 TaxID=3015157 RepID=UPI0022B68EF9|nr:hypothetical protein [Micromonospora sp. WMMC273]MCZ7478819.1 hypothetical protein [Micromonospora sp. WMMC273]MCZ7478947.1 hypothetical protein [Micromonospora sp. WMMC273]